MKNWERAWLYIRRKKDKSIVLFAIMWACITCGLVAATFWNSSETTVTRLKEKLSGYFTVVPNRDVEGATRKFTDEFCETIMADDNILTYNGMDVYYMAVPELMLTPGKFTGEGNEELAHGACFIASTDTRYNEKFYLNEMELIEGEHIHEDDEGMALISEQLAKDNGLKLGDTFDSVVTDYYAGVEESLGKSFTYRVKGIYHIKDSKDYSSGAESGIPENTIFTDVQTDRSVLSELGGMRVNWFRYGVNFYIKDSADFENTVKRIEKEYALDTEDFQIERNNGKYRDSAEPLEKIIHMTKIFIFGMVVLGVSVLGVILFMWMKERRYEVGIYLAAGLEKKDILMQLLTESLVLYCVAFVISVISTGIVVEELQYLMLEKESAGAAGMLPSNLGGMVVIVTAVLGCVITVAAVLISFLSIARMTLREILSANE